MNAEMQSGMTFLDAALFMAALTAATGIIAGLLKMLWSARTEGVNKDVNNLADIVRRNRESSEKDINRVEKALQVLRDERHDNTDAIAENHGRWVLLDDDLNKFKSRTHIEFGKRDYLEKRAYQKEKGL